MEKKDCRKLFSAELRSFSSTKTLESSSECVSLGITCTQVVIQKIDLGIDEERHRIVVLNESSEEVCTYAVDDITHLHHTEENHVKLNGTNEWNLILKDRSDVKNFVKMVEEFSKCSLQTSRTQIKHASTSVKTDFVVPEEEKNVSAPLGQVPAKVDPFTAPPTSTASKSVFEKITNTTLPPPGESNNEAIPSENEVIMDDITENTVPKPSTDDNEDDDVPMSPVVPSVDYRVSSSTPITVNSLSNAGSKQDILKSSIATNNPPKSALVGGMAHNTGMVQNEQHSAREGKPEKLQFDPTQDAGTPVTDLSAGSERSTLSRGGACFFDSSRGANDEGFHIEIDDSYDRYYKKMVSSYKKTLTSYWSGCSSSDSKKVHRVIAALMCRNGNSCYTALLSTGTYHNDLQKCGSTSTCDGHAVSICYEAAPKYFLKELKSLDNGDASIFECLPNEEGYRLKDGVSFHLLMTQFPCGFIRDQKDACMEWKVPFVEFPHVPTCSSRILIGATMGIQGYISHLLDKPIVIDSLVVLCTDIDRTRVLEFGNSFKMPKVIKTMKYDPKDFWPGSFRPLNSAGSNKSFTEYESHGNTSYESADGNETATSDGPGLERPDDSYLIVATPERGEMLTFLKFDPRSTREKSSHFDFSIKTRDIDQHFEVNEGLRVQRISYLKQLYNGLANHLNLEEALEMLRVKLSTESKSKEEAVSSLIISISTELTGASNALGTNAISEQQWDSYIQKEVEKRLHHMREEGRIKIRNQNMVECIKTILSKETDNIIMDCNWHQYLHALPSSFQPSDE